jgi:hypothetical protein
VITPECIQVYIPPHGIKVIHWEHLLREVNTEIGSCWELAKGMTPILFQAVSLNNLDIALPAVEGSSLHRKFAWGTVELQSCLM